MTTTPDITILGGGIIGLLTARELARTGADVTLLEKNAIGQEASWAGGGILLPIYPWRQAPAISALVSESLKLYPPLINELLNESGIDPERNPCGLFITRNSDFDCATKWCDTYRIPYDSLPPPGIDQSINYDADRPLWLPEIAHARNPRLLKSAKQAVLNLGVKVIEHCTPYAISLEHGKINRLETSAGPMPIGHLIIATGAWTGKLFKECLANFVSPEIEPVKGQMLLFEASPETLPCMVLQDDHYLIPRFDGHILAGSSVEHTGFDKSTTNETFKRLKSFAESLCPKLGKARIAKHWAGLRPGTKKGIPYVCRHPEIENLSINAGHFRNGLVMAPASAQLLADLILNRPCRLDPKPYHLDSAH